LDLISFIPGIGVTAAFTPGATTSSPLNTTHTGATNGSGPSTSTNNVAEIYNRLLLQVASVIVKSGLSIDNNNWAQLGDAVQQIANNVAGSYVTTSAYNADFVNNLTASGYADIKGGLIFHWRTFTCPGGGSDLALSISPAFPTGCLGAVCASGDSSRILSISAASPPTASTVTVNNGGNTGFMFAWGH